MSHHSSATRPAQSSRQDLPSLSSILNLEPDQEPWCAGFAPSQGRRCYVRTNSYGRRCAMTLLEEGTEILRAGEDISDILEGLAPYVLCTRFHQSQAPSLVASWRKRVRSAIRAIPRPARESPTTLTSRSTTPNTSQPTQPNRNAGVSPQPRPARQNEQSYALNQRLSGSTSETQLPRDTLRIPVRSRGLNLTLTGDSGSENEITLLTTLPRDTAAQRTVSHARTLGTVRLQRAPQVSVSNQLPNSSPQTESRAQSLGSSRSRASTTSSTRTAPPRVHTSQPRTTGQRASHVTPPTRNEVIRKPMTEPCPICLEELQESTDNRLHIPSRRDAGSNDNSSGNTDSDSDSPSERGVKLLEAIAKKHAQKVTYCKAYCGNNFHVGCVQDWLGTAPRPTCPMCRKMWKN